MRVRIALVGTQEDKEAQTRSASLPVTDWCTKVILQINLYETFPICKSASESWIIFSCKADPAVEEMMHHFNMSAGNKSG